MEVTYIMSACHWENLTIQSNYDQLPLSAFLCIPEGSVRGIVQLVHGMAEHKERYQPVMEALAAQGFAAFLHDHRGHGASVQSPADLGFMNDETGTAIVEDVYQCTCLLKQRFPGVPLTLFGHSMGSLVVRKYLKQHDDAIDGLIACGVVSGNPAAGVAVGLAKLIGLVKGMHHRPALVQSLALGSNNKAFPEAKSPSAWLNTDEAAVAAYDADPLCGFVFTCNGFMNLFHLVSDCFDKRGWQMKKPELPILLIAGGDDPVIGGEAGWAASQQMLADVGYTNVQAKLYPGMRHEILNEPKADIVVADLLAFIGR